MAGTPLPWAVHGPQNLWSPGISQPLFWPHAEGWGEAGGAAIHPSDGQCPKNVLLGQRGRGQAERVVAGNTRAWSKLEGLGKTISQMSSKTES